MSTDLTEKASAAPSSPSAGGLRIPPIATQMGIGAVAGSAFLIFYYAVLGYLPPTSIPSLSDGNAAWMSRLDMSQLVGTWVVPPIPTRETWFVGFACVAMALVSGGPVFGLIMNWFRRRPAIWDGIAFGFVGFVMLGVTAWLAMGCQPAVMAGYLPDAGFFLFGWSGLATMQLFFCFALYGVVLGAAMRRFG